MKDNILKVSIDTNIAPDGLITQKIYQEFNNQKELFISKIINIQEKQFREALIKLGWIPPK